MLSGRAIVLALVLLGCGSGGGGGGSGGSGAAAGGGGAAGAGGSGAAGAAGSGAAAGGGSGGAAGAPVHHDVLCGTDFCSTACCVMPPSTEANCMASCPAGSTTIACWGEDCGGFACCASLASDGNVLSAHCSSTHSCDAMGVESVVLCIGTVDCPNPTAVQQCCPTGTEELHICGGSGPTCN